MAYQHLVDEQFAIGLGAAGTRIAKPPSRSLTALWSLLLAYVRQDDDAFEAVEKMHDPDQC